MWTLYVHRLLWIHVRSRKLMTIYIFKINTSVSNCFHIFLSIGSENWKVQVHARLQKLSWLKSQPSLIARYFLRGQIQRAHQFPVAWTKDGNIKGQEANGWPPRVQRHAKETFKKHRSCCWRTTSSAAHKLAQRSHTTRSTRTMQSSLIQGRSQEKY